jgi:hypothetical protein
MPDFHLAATINQIGPHQFFVTASAVPANGGERAAVLTVTAPSLQQTNVDMKDLLIELGSKMHRLKE